MIIIDSFPKSSHRLSPSGGSHPASIKTINRADSLKGQRLLKRFLWFMFARGVVGHERNCSKA